MASPMDLEDADNTQYDGEDGDEVVFEMDVYSAGGALGKPSSNGYLLQFPLRSQDRPYEDPTHVRLKSKVKRMQWDIPLDRSHDTYHHESDHRVHNFTLQSSRVDPGMQGLAVGVRNGKNLFLMPVNEVLQLRHSPAYLDTAKEREEKAKTARGGGTGSGADAEVKQEDGGGPKPSELMPITVQVKKHETEQQTEARLRSYAHFAQQEEADQWIPLNFRGIDNIVAVEMLEKAPKEARKQASHAAMSVLPKSAYLEAFAPGSTTSLEIDIGQGEATVVDELGRPLPSKGSGQISADALAALPAQLKIFFQNTSVLTLENIRNLLINLPNSGVLNRAGQNASDAALHSVIMDQGIYLHIRKAYMLRTLNNPTIDPLRNLVLDLLQEKEFIKKGEVAQAAKGVGIQMSEAMYNKVMHDLCATKGSVWGLKITGGAA